MTRQRKLGKARVDFERISAASQRSLGIPSLYEDVTYWSVVCGKECLFSARRQKVWYEEKKRYYWQRPIRCDNCFRVRQQPRSAKFHMDRSLAALQDAQGDRELMRQCALQIVDYHRQTGRGNLPLAIHLLNAQDSEENEVLEALAYCRDKLRRS